jgi:hypothetical protein
VSLKFDKVEKHLVDMLMLIDQNQNIKRYIKYLSNTPLDKTDEQPDINDSLINDNLILTPYNDKIITEPKVVLFCNPMNGDLESENVGEEIFTIDMIVPISSWVLQGQGKLRTFRISAEIAKLIDDKDVTGIGKVKITKFKCYKVNDSNAGMTIWIRVNTATSKGLR